MHYILQHLHLDVGRDLVRIIYYEYVLSINMAFLVETCCSWLLVDKIVLRLNLHLFYLLVYLNDCDRSPAEIVGSNPAGGMNVACCECCVLSGRVLCDGLITCPEDTYRLWCVVVCDLETSSRMRRPWSTLGCGAIGKQNINTGRYLAYKQIPTFLSHEWFSSSKMTCCKIISVPKCEVKYD